MSSNFNMQPFFVSKQPSFAAHAIASSQQQFEDVLVSSYQFLCRETRLSLNLILDKWKYFSIFEVSPSK